VEAAGVMRWCELTPRGGGGVSVLSIHGAGALDAVRTLAPQARLELGRHVLARLELDGELLDEALVCAHGAEHVELQLHGSPPLVRRIGRWLGGGDARCVAHGAPGRESAAGDASQAVADAWNYLQAAASEAAARMLLDQTEGALERELARLDGLSPERRATGLRDLEERSRVAGYLITPPRLLIAGPVNAGKSTLFNVLLGKRRAITSDVEGTTRDLLRETAQLGAWAVQLVDSAGDRDLVPSQAVERAGQDLGRRERAAADLTVWLQPPNAPEPPALEVGERRVIVAGRGDLPAAAPGALRALEDPGAARDRIARLLCAELGLPEQPWTPGAGVRLERR
jgi:tRNA modification GTPase